MELFLRGLEAEGTSCGTRKGEGRDMKSQLRSLLEIGVERRREKDGERT